MLKRAMFFITIVALSCAVQSARAQVEAGLDNTAPEAKKPVLVRGCWQGTVFNTASCSGDCPLTLVFAQKGKSISKHGSTYDIQYDMRPELTNVISGKTASGKSPIKFHGAAFKGCEIQFVGDFPQPGLMDGNFHFSGSCNEDQLKGDFSATFVAASCP